MYDTVCMNADISSSLLVRHVDLTFRQKVMVLLTCSARRSAPTRRPSSAAREVVGVASDAVHDVVRLVEHARFRRVGDAEQYHAVVQRLGGTVEERELNSGREGVEQWKRGSRTVEEREWVRGISVTKEKERKKVGRIRKMGPSE
jgi:hypothetical protein